MHRRFISAVLSLCVVAAAAAASDAPALTAATAAAEIRAAGGRAFIDKHFYQASWSTVLRGIESANPKWLAIGEALKPHSDAGASEELDLAFSSALAINPLRVLQFGQRIYKKTPAELCNRTFEAELPKQGVKTYLDSIEKGLRLAKTQSDRSMAASCRIGLAASRKHARDHGLN